MDLKQFYFYIAIAEECNLSRAAEKLFISPSSLSRFLARLEDSLNVRLFLRMKNNSLVITEEGRDLLACYQRVVRELESCANRISDRTPGDKKRIIFGVPGIPALRKVTEILPEFTKLHPETTVELVNFPINKLVDLLYKGEIDLVRSAYDEKNPAMNYIPIGPKQLSLFVHAEHPLAQHKKSGDNADSPPVSLEQFADTPFVLLAEGSALRKTTQRYFNQIGFSPKRIIEVSSSISAVAFIEAGLAVGLLWNECAEDSQAVCTLKIDPPLYCDAAFIYRKDAYLSKSEKDLIRLCRSKK